MNKRKHHRHFLLIAALAIILVLAGCSSEGGQVNLPCGHTAEVEDQADHQSCSLCGGYVCSGEHGDGICVEPAADATVSAAAESTPAPVQEPTPAPTPTPIPKSSDSYLRVFNATFPNGKFVDMKDSQARKNITVTNVYSVDVSAITSDSRASVSGDVGTLELEDGINEFIVTVTAEDGSKSHFEYSITVLKPAPKRRPVPVTTDPVTTDPGTTDPGTTDPGTTDPGTTDPGTTDPGTTDPGTMGPGTTDPGNSNNS